MTKVNLYEAKTHLSQLVERAAAGEEIVIAKNGEPVARLTALRTAQPGLRIGAARGKFEPPEPDAAFDADVARLFKDAD